MIQKHTGRRSVKWRSCPVYVRIGDFVQITPFETLLRSLHFSFIEKIQNVFGFLYNDIYTLKGGGFELIHLEPEPEDDVIFTVNIFAPKLKRLELSFFINTFHECYMETVSIDVDAPSLEKLSYEGNMLVFYSSKDAKTLRNARINFTGGPCRTNL